MPTYVMLSRLTPEGIRTLSDRPERITEVNQEVEGLGAKVVAQYSLLGQYDFVTVLEAPDVGTMARLSANLGRRGTARYETLAAVPVEEFISLLKG